jgi:hypothetical protein
MDDEDKVPWIGTKPDGYYRYDKDGKPTTLICYEDGTKPNEIVPYIRR